MTVYVSIEKYIESGNSLAEKIQKIDQMIMALTDTGIKAAVSEDKAEYTLDNGQTKVNVVYRGIDSIAKSIENLQALRNSLQATLNNNITGRNVRLRPGFNLN